MRCTVPIVLHFVFIPCRKIVIAELRMVFLKIENILEEETSFLEDSKGILVRILVE